MENNRIKSALELALERAERLGSASTEELRRQEEEKHLLVGKGLTDKYLAGLPLRDVEEQMRRYPDSAGGAVKRGFLNTLAELIRPGDNERIAPLLQAILHFAPSEQITEIASQIERQQQDYASRKQSSLAARRDEFEIKAAAALANQGISGSAVRPNLDVSPNWRQALDDFDVAHEARLAPIRQQLKSAIQNL